MQLPFTYFQPAKFFFINFMWFSLNPPGIEAFREKKTLILESLVNMWTVTTEQLLGRPPPTPPRWTARRFTPPEANGDIN